MTSPHNRHAVFIRWHLSPSSFNWYITDRLKVSQPNQVWVCLQEVAPKQECLLHLLRKVRNDSSTTPPNFWHKTVFPEPEIRLCRHHSLSGRIPHSGRFLRSFHGSWLWNLQRSNLSANNKMWTFRKALFGQVRILSYSRLNERESVQIC